MCLDEMSVRTNPRQSVCGPFLWWSKWVLEEVHEINLEDIATSDGYVVYKLCAYVLSLIL